MLPPPELGCGAGRCPLLLEPHEPLFGHAFPAETQVEAYHVGTDRECYLGRLACVATLDCCARELYVLDDCVHVRGQAQRVGVLRLDAPERAERRFEVGGERLSSLAVCQTARRLATKAHHLGALAAEQTHQVIRPLLERRPLLGAVRVPLVDADDPAPRAPDIPAPGRADRPEA